MWKRYVSGKRKKRRQERWIRPKHSEDDLLRFIRKRNTNIKESIRCFSTVALFYTYLYFGYFCATTSFSETFDVLFLNVTQNKIVHRLF